MKTLIVAALLAGVMSAGAGVAAAAAQIDLNSASVAQLEDLPGVGPAKAAAIVDARTAQRFTSVQDLERVKGIGPAMIAELEDRVSIGKPANGQP
jgi:competence protein ComEA